MTNDPRSELIFTGQLAADIAVINELAQSPAGLPTRRIVELAVNTAIRHLIDNGMISVTPESDWPEFIDIGRAPGAAVTP